MNKLTKYIIVITTVSAAVMELIDTSIVNVALTDMAGSLGAVGAEPLRTRQDCMLLIQICLGFSHF